MQQSPLLLTTPLIVPVHRVPLRATGLASGLSRQGEGPDPRQKCKHGVLTPHAHTLVSVGQMQGTVDLADFFLPGIQTLSP